MRRSITQNQYIQIMDSTDSLEELALRHRIGRSTIGKCKRGEVYKDWYEAYIASGKTPAANRIGPRRGMKKKPLKYHEYCQIMRDSRTVHEIADDWGRTADIIQRVLSGKMYVQFYQRFRETNRIAREAVEAMDVQVHWSITSPWGTQHTPDCPAGYYAEAA